MELVKQLKEVTLSVLPIALFTIVISAFSGVMSGIEILHFGVSCLMVIVGLTLFLTGVDVGISPVGNKIGGVMTRSRSLVILLVSTIFLGVIITLPEPDIQVLAGQVVAVKSNIPKMLLIVSIALGVGVFLSLSIARTIMGWNMKLVIAASYIALFIIAFFNEESFVAIAFDSGGATTGPLSVPFIMALGMGVAATRKHNEENEFGYVAFASVGSVIAVLIMGIFFKGPSSAALSVAGESSHTMRAIFVSKLGEVGLSLLPLIVVVTVMQILFLRMPRTETIRVFVGFLYGYIGMVVFFTGTEYSFSSVAMALGSSLVNKPVALIVTGFVFGLCVVLAEPAVMVLTGRVADASSGRIPKAMMLFALAIGVGLAVTLSLLRTVFSLSIWALVIPIYAIILLMMLRTPGLFSAIAFDSGGVATGPMSSAFLLPFSMGAAAGIGSGATSVSSFGMITMIAAMPILIVELIGLYFNIKLKAASGRNK